jgi:RNA polymerase sigma-70 factor (ECF subfamily)
MAAPRIADEAFTQFVAAHGAMARRVAWRLMGGDGAAAEDVVQNAFVKAHAKFETVLQEGAREAWFRQVVVREALNQLRWLGVRRRVAQLAGFDDRAQPAPMRDGGAVARIERAVAALSPQQRAIFVLVHLEEQTVAEAAAQLGIAEGTAKSHLHRALTSLRTQLEDLR